MRAIEVSSATGIDCSGCRPNQAIEFGLLFVIWTRAMDTPLADGKGVLVDAYGNAQSSRDVIARFPSLRKDLEFDADLLHPQMGTLAAAVREAVSAGDTHLPLQICTFRHEALSKPNAISEIENGVAISFVEA